MIKKELGSASKEEHASYKYLVQCWIRPKSGFDLARKNRLLNIFKEIMASDCPDNKELEDYLKQFEKRNEGFILEPIVLETDKEVTDAEKELMPEVHKNYPEAKLLSWESLPDFENPDSTDDEKK